jgi:hypothetical protein
MKQLASPDNLGKTVAQPRHPSDVHNHEATVKQSNSRNSCPSSILGIVHYPYALAYYQRLDKFNFGSSVYIHNSKVMDEMNLDVSF